MRALTKPFAPRVASFCLWSFERRCCGVVFESEVGNDFREETCSFARRIRRVLPLREDPVLLKPNSHRVGVDFSILQNCVIAVDKPVASLTFELIDRARLAMGARHYRIGHGGVLDVMASGLVLLLFGNATKQMGQISQLEREYVGAFRLGHTTQTYDVLSPVISSRPWMHVTNGQVEREVQCMMGQTLQLSPPSFLGKATHKDTLCHLRHISEANKHPRPMDIKAFEVHRDRDVPSDFNFRVVCCTKLSINCLIHEVGERLGCGAHVRHSHRIRLGDFNMRDAWNADELMEHIAHLRRTAYLKNFDLYDRMKHAYWRPIGPRTNKKKKRIKRRWEKEQKRKREIKEGKREPVMEALCY